MIITGNEHFPLTCVWGVRWTTATHIQNAHVSISQTVNKVSL